METHRSLRSAGGGAGSARRWETVQRAGTSQKPRVRYDVHGWPKPLMRGWIHAVAAPIALIGCIVAICRAPSSGLKAACSVYLACSLCLFGNSAAYHLGDWSPKTTDILRRIDHANIFLLIAGTYTPVAFALSAWWRNFIIASMWSATAAALIVTVVWISAPRWLSTAVYVVYGVYGVAFTSLFWTSPCDGHAVTALILAGGAIYIAGAVVYATRKPDPWPRVFGFHEVFHTCTALAYACHMVAVFLILTSVRV